MKLFITNWNFTLQRRIQKQERYVPTQVYGYPLHTKQIVTICGKKRVKSRKLTRMTARKSRHRLKNVSRYNYVTFDLIVRSYLYIDRTWQFCILIITRDKSCIFFLCILVCTTAHTHWARHNQKLKNKMKVKDELKRPEQILKARKLLERKLRRNGRKSRKGQKGHKSGKNKH